MMNLSMWLLDEVIGRCLLKAGAGAAPESKSVESFVIFVSVPGSGCRWTPVAYFVIAWRF
jgi:hypothetical protein